MQNNVVRILIIIIIIIQLHFIDPKKKGKRKGKIVEYISVFCNSTLLHSRPIHLYYNLIFWSKIHTSFCVQDLSHSSAAQVLLLVPSVSCCSTFHFHLPYPNNLHILKDLKFCIFQPFHFHLSCSPISFSPLPPVLLRISPTQC
jgi:hypothetical protein